MRQGRAARNESTTVSRGLWQWGRSHCPLGPGNRFAILTRGICWLLMALMLGLALSGCRIGSTSDPVQPTPTTPASSDTTPAPTALATLPMTPAATATTTSPVRARGTATAGEASPGVPTTATLPILTPSAGPIATGTATLQELQPFTSETHPYSIGYPGGWTASGGGLRVGDVRGDVFSTRTQTGEVSVNVLSEQLPDAELDTERYAQLTSEQIQRSGVKSPARAGETTVAGNTAVLLNWEDVSRPGQVYEITQAVWVANGRGWVVTLAAPRGERARYLPVLRSMLGSMQLR
ncbi:MAG: hypothetical protein M3Q29_05415 [Chloroflexota bacterium]|nr:hypothetical protein [Chloroflexota bacterium]